MRASIAADALQVYSIVHPAAPKAVGGVARLVGALKHPELLATELKHLGHEGQFV
jgi:hypothetical protein